MGSLNTSMGEGNITLVAGGLSHRVFANTDGGYLNVVHMAFTPEPGASMMLGGALLAIGGLYYGVRRRKA
ncbi:MAG: LPXTG cell wall anchor domain-containing protein [Myxococcota bacterium]